MRSIGRLVGFARAVQGIGRRSCPDRGDLVGIGIAGWEQRPEGPAEPPASLGPRSFGANAIFRVSLVAPLGGAAIEAWPLSQFSYSPKGIDARRAGTRGHPAGNPI